MTRPARDRGSVTAELALGLPAVVVVLALVLGVGRVTAERLACEDAARAGARAAALGEPAGAAAGARTGAGAEVAVRDDGGWVTVVVSRDVQLGGWSSPVTVRATAVARVEP